MRRSRLVPWVAAGFGATLFACAVADNGFSEGNAHDSGAHPIDSGVSGDAPGDSSFDVPPIADTGVGVDTAVADSGTGVDSSKPDTKPPADTGAGVDTASDDTTTPLDTGSDGGAPDVPLGCVPVINEIQSAGVSAADEFIEIYNPCSATFPLAGYKLVYRSHTNVYDVTAAHDGPAVYTFGATDSIAAMGWFVVGGAAYTGPKDASETSTTGDLAAASGQVGLRDPAGRLVNGVFYGALPTTGTPAFLEGTPAPSPAASSSIYRAPDGKETGDNGVDFSAANPTPTPKAANPGT